MSYKYSLGIDIGGSKMEAAIIELSDNKNLPNPISLDESNIQSFKILIRKRIPTNRDYGYKDVLARLQNLIQDIILESKVNASDILEVGIGLPGSVHPETLKMIHGNSQIFENRPIKEDLLFFFKESLNTSLLILRLSLLAIFSVVVAIVSALQGLFSFKIVSVGAIFLLASANFFSCSFCLVLYLCENSMFDNL